MFCYLRVWRPPRYDILFYFIIAVLLSRCLASAARLLLPSFRGVCRKLGQGEVGYVATTHTMSGVYRKWDSHWRNPLESTWKTTPKAKEQAGDLGNTNRVVPGATASKGQVWHG